MTSKSRDTGAFVMVSLDREDGAVSKIMEILEPLGIPIEVVGHGRQLRRTPSVMFRVPHHRVAETLLALELQGFPDVLAYENLESPRGTNESAVTDGSDRGPDMTEADAQRDHGAREPDGGPSSGSNGRGEASPNRAQH